MDHNDYADGYRAGYAAGYDDGCQDRAALEARVRGLEAEVLEARAEAAQWARELDGERAAVVAWLRSQVSQRVGEDDLAYDHAASAIAAGKHRAMANRHASPDPTADRAQLAALGQRGDQG